MKTAKYAAIIATIAETGSSRMASACNLSPTAAERHPSIRTVDENLIVQEVKSAHLNGRYLTSYLCISMMNGCERTTVYASIFTSEVISSILGS